MDETEMEKIRKSIVDETVKMYEAGMPIGGIAEELGKSVTTVYALLREGGVEPKRREESQTRSIVDALPKEIVEQVTLDYVKGVSMSRIVRTSGLSINTVYKILKETGTALRRSEDNKAAFDMRLEKAVQMYKDGDKLIKIEMETGVQSNQLDKALYKQEVQLRRDIP